MVCWWRLDECRLFCLLFLQETTFLCVCDFGANLLTGTGGGAAQKAPEPEAKPSAQSQSQIQLQQAIQAELEASELYIYNSCRLYNWEIDANIVAKSQEWPLQLLRPLPPPQTLCSPP